MIFLLIVLGVVLLLVGTFLLIKRQKLAGVIVLALAVAALALPVLSYLALALLILSQGE